MLESKFQSKLIKKLKKDGWYVIKIIKASPNGLPDLLALKPNDVRFIEVKGKKGVVSELQKFRIKELKDKGFKAEVNYEPN